MTKKARRDLEEAYRAARSRQHRAESRVRAMGECASAAAALLDIGDTQGALVVLSTVRRAYLDSMRETVAHEPGGVAYRGTSPGAGEDPTKGGG